MCMAPVSPVDQFQDELRAKEQQFNAYCCVLGQLGSEDSEDEYEESEDEEREPSLEQLRSLQRVFLPAQTRDYYAELSNQLERIGCTDDEDDAAGVSGPEADVLPRFSIRMLNTRHSYPMHNIIKDSLKAVDRAIRSESWEDAFSRWSATFLAARSEEHWWCDTDVPEVPVAIYKKMKTQWNKLKRRSDEELGSPQCEGSEAPTVKRTFDKYLQKLAEDMEEMGYDV